MPEYPLTEQSGNLAEVFEDVSSHILISAIIRQQLTNNDDVREEALKGTDLTGFKRVLDIGCGFGFFTEGLAGRLHPEAEVTGIDRFRKYCEPYLENAAKAGSKGKFIPEGVSVIKQFEDRSYDLVICSYALYFFPECIREISRILDDNGMFIVITHSCPHMKELTVLVKRILAAENIPHDRLLPYEILINRFCDYNGTDLLNPWFGEVHRKEFHSEIAFDQSDYDNFAEYFRFKTPFFLPFGVEEEDRLTRKILEKVHELLRTQGQFQITKDDTIFVCSKPLKKNKRMKSSKRNYCPYCGQHLEIKAEGDALRDYCDNCEVYFYDNPLPVVSAIIEKDRKILLVKRKHDPNKGEWCLPMGFAESGESIESAALRELNEETGIHGKIIDMIDVVSGYSKSYGDLIFITFEAEQIGGNLAAGDDASEVGFFAFNKLPKLAFSSNMKAIESYVQSKQDYWAIIDSFSKSEGIAQTNGKDYLSNKLLRLIDRNAETIARNYLADVKSNKSTPTYANFDEKRVYERAMKLIVQFSNWIGGKYSDKEVRENYLNLGMTRKKEGFMLSEVLSALSLIRKHIWEFALSHQVWTKTIDIYRSLELERRMVLFFDKAAFYVTKGYED